MNGKGEIHLSTNGLIMNRKAQEIDLDDGLVLQVAPLTMGQIETLVEASIEIMTVSEQRAMLWRQIEASLNNAQAGQPTIQQLKETITLEQWLLLLKKVREVSHLI